MTGVLKVYSGGVWYPIYPGGGPQGPQGAQGVAGADLAGEVGDKGATGPAGASIQGPQGDKGDKGDSVQGPQGDQGPQGAMRSHLHYLSYNSSAQVTGIDQSGDSWAVNSDGSKEYFRMASDSSGSNAAWVRARVENLSHTHTYHKPNTPTGGVSYS